MAESFESHDDPKTPSEPVLRKDLAVPPRISFDALSDEGHEIQNKIPEMLSMVQQARMGTEAFLAPIRRMAGTFEYKEGRTEEETAFLKVLKESITAIAGNPNAPSQKDQEEEIPVMELFDKADWLAKNGSFAETERVLLVANTRMELLSVKIQRAYFQAQAAPHGRRETGGTNDPSGGSSHAP
jgi:hypothetical protein